MTENCPLDRCPDILRNNGQCDPRCNIAVCANDFGDCEGGNGGDDAEDPLATDGLIQVVFFVVLGIVGVMIVGAIGRTYLFGYSSYFGMSPYERGQILLGLRTREQITGEPDNDETERNTRNVDDYEVANPIAMANALSTQIESGDRANLPVADTASQASSRLPEAAEYNSQVENDSDNEDGNDAGEGDAAVRVEIAGDDDNNDADIPELEIPENEVVVRTFSQAEDGQGNNNNGAQRDL